ncbi:MAG: TetR/AcrR family transcriptional regulator [Acidobacteria bacterium]|nr:MAG: TetR/AcrR family transcriptional regulator [Acidobacteriota bacterium]
MPGNTLFYTPQGHMQNVDRKSKSRRLTREEFLARALEVLSQEGESELRIDRLVAALGVTKGSFYWHFENRADFVRSLARYWERWSTDRAVEELGDLEGEPKRLLLELHELVTREDLARYDLVMRSWATHEPEVAHIVESVDRTRLDFVGRLFRRLGYRGDDLDIRTRLFVVSSSMWSVINRNEDKDLRLKRLAAVLDILTHP